MTRLSGHDRGRPYSDKLDLLQAGKADSAMSLAL
jgi:hypothetical protein